MTKAISILFVCLMFHSTANALDVIYFKTAVLPPTQFEKNRAKKSGKELVEKQVETILGRFVIPPGVGPFPAIVLLHGCAGIRKWNDLWIERLVNWGYAVLDVDSLSPRGEWSICGTFSVNAFTRALDAHGAKSYLKNQSDIDPNRIGVLGMSHGGWSLLLAISGDLSEKFGPFHAAVAFYPVCESNLVFDTPLKIFIGQNDDWTPASRCKNAMPAHETKHELSLKIYPDAHHLFDVEGMDIVELGHVLRYNQAAATDAIAESRNFLNRFLQ